MEKDDKIDYYSQFLQNFTSSFCANKNNKAKMKLDKNLQVKR